MSRTNSSTTSRLVHISDLPNNNFFNIETLRDSLPVHHSSLKENLLIIIHNQRHNLSHRLFHDPNLKVNSNSTYTKIRGGWVEDIDMTLEDDGEHLKKSIEVGVMVLNYLKVINQAKVANRERIPPTEEESGPSSESRLVEFITKASSAEVKLFEPDSDQLLTSKKRTSSLFDEHDSESSLSGETSRRGQTQDRSLGSILGEQLFSEKSVTVCFNIYKKSKKYIFLTGINESYTQNYMNCLQLVRNWNVARLKAEAMVSPLRIHRIDVFLEHLFAISRSFQESPKILDLTNQNKQILANLIDQQIPDLSRPLDGEIKTEPYFVSSLKKNELTSMLDSEMVFLHFGLTYKSSSESLETSEEFMTTLESYLSKILYSVMIRTPKNTGLSYHCKSVHKEQTNQIFILFVLNFKSSQIKRKAYSQQDINNTIERISSFIQSQSYHSVSESTGKNLIDQVFKQSYQIYSKYNQEPSSASRLSLAANSQINDSRLDSNPKMNNRSSKQNVSKRGELSQAQRSVSEKSLSQSQSRHFLPTKGLFASSSAYTEMYKSYWQLSEFLEQMGSVTLRPLQIKSQLQNILKPLQEELTQQNLQPNEIASLEFLGQVCHILSSYDIFVLLEKCPDNMDQILHLLMQQTNFRKILQVSKFYCQDVESNFVDYIHGTDNSQSEPLINKSQKQSNFSKHRYSRFMKFLKKLILIYGSKQSDSHKDAFTELQISQLVFLLQRKSFNCRQYKDLVTTRLKDIFPVSNPPNKNFSLVCPILADFFDFLTKKKGHHQELVCSFIAEIAFEVLHFYHETADTVNLNNSLYRTSKLNVKEKKFRDIVREGGFLNFGYHFKKQILHTLLQNRRFHNFRWNLVCNIHISRPVYFSKFITILQSSVLTESFTAVSAELRKFKNNFFGPHEVNRSVSKSYYPQQFDSLKTLFSTNPQDNPNSRRTSESKIYENLSSEQSEHLESIEFSESGIFKDLLLLNPNIKIAGVELKKEYSRRIEQKQNQRSKFTLDFYLRKIFEANIDEIWEYIQLVRQLKHKAEDLESMKAEEQNADYRSEILYFQETLQHVYAKISEIERYIELSHTLSNIREQRESSHSL